MRKSPCVDCRCKGDYETCDRPDPTLQELITQAAQKEEALLDPPTVWVAMRLWAKEGAANNGLAVFGIFADPAVAMRKIKEKQQNRALTWSLTNSKSGYSRYETQEVGDHTNLVKYVVQETKMET